MKIAKGLGKVLIGGMAIKKIIGVRESADRANSAARASKRLARSAPSFGGGSAAA